MPAMKSLCSVVLFFGVIVVREGSGQITTCEESEWSAEFDFDGTYYEFQDTLCGGNCDDCVGTGGGLDVGASAVGEGVRLPSTVLCCESTDLSGLIPSATVDQCALILINETSGLPEFRSLCYGTELGLAPTATTIPTPDPTIRVDVGSDLPTRAPVPKPTASPVPSTPSPTNGGSRVATIPLSVIFGASLLAFFV